MITIVFNEKSGYWELRKSGVVVFRHIRLVVVNEYRMKLK